MPTPACTCLGSPPRQTLAHGTAALGAEGLNGLLHELVILSAVVAQGMSISTMALTHMPNTHITSNLKGLACTMVSVSHEPLIDRLKTRSSIAMG